MAGIYKAHDLLVFYLLLGSHHPDCNYRTLGRAVKYFILYFQLVDVVHFKPAVSIECWRLFYLAM